MRFDERYTLVHNRITHSDPAWICQNPLCAHEERVRRS
jgi:hypothetical protein